MTQLADQLAGAVDSSMAETRSRLDFHIAAEAVRVHFLAVTSPDGNQDDRTKGMQQYAATLRRPRVEIKGIEHAAEQLLNDSLSPDFLAWSAEFIRKNPLITTDDIAKRLSEITAFVGMRSLTATDHTMDQLMAAEEAARIAVDKELVRYKAAVKKAKDKLAALQSDYDECGRRRCWLSATTHQIDQLTERTGDETRKAVQFAWSRHLKRKRDSTRVQKPIAESAEQNKAGEPK